MKKSRLITTLFGTLLLSACGGGGSSSGSSVTTEDARDGRDCIELNTNQNPITVKNTCDNAVVFRELANTNTKPITIGPKKSVQYTVTTSLILYGACTAPFTPVDVSDEFGFECV